MIVRLKLSASETNKTECVSVSDLGYTDDEWSKLTDSEKENLLQSHCDELPDQPYWVIDSQEEW